jgi:hypothetical protein
VSQRRATDVSEAVQRDLRATIPDAPQVGLIWTLFTACFTFGLYPAVIWPLRFRNVIDAERRRLGRLARWVESRTGHPDAPRLTLAADAIRFRPLPYLVGFGSCAAAVGLFFALGGRLSPTVLVEYLYPSHPAMLSHGDWDRLLLQRGVNAPVWALRNAIFTIWVIALSTAFLTHWLQVRAHARSVRRFLDAFNKVAIEEGLSPVFLAPVGWGLGPTSVFWALVMTAMNAPWGVALMLAGAVQRRYAGRAGPEMRKALATRVGEMNLLPRATVGAGRFAERPVRSVAAPVDRRTRCATEGCRLPLPAGARFCPRCGRRAVSRVDRVA